MNTTARPDALYASRRLELLFLPAGLAADVVEFGRRTFYRLTPPVLVWFEHAVAELDARRPAPSPAEVAEVVSAQRTIYAFARATWTEQDLADARRAGPQPLPEPERVPTL